MRVEGPSVITLSASLAGLVGICFLEEGKGSPLKRSRSVGGPGDGGLYQDGPISSQYIFIHT